MIKLPLVEVFESVQGEGANSGRSSIFVRFAGCNLACEFAPGVVCDTPYMKANEHPTIEELFDRLPKMIHRPGVGGPASDFPMLVLTGGEPTLSPHFDAVMGHAKRAGWYVAVETNGTRWRDGLHAADYITVSPKQDVAQTSKAPLHNHHAASPDMNRQVVEEMRRRHNLGTRWTYGGEYRFVLAHDSPFPPFSEAPYHYVSPAILSDGSGEEWKTGFPGFAPGALERCLEVVRHDPRWRVSLQIHKFMGVR